MYVSIQTKLELFAQKIPHAVNKTHTRANKLQTSVIKTGISTFSPCWEVGSKCEYDFCLISLFLPCLFSVYNGFLFMTYVLFYCGFSYQFIHIKFLPRRRRWFYLIAVWSVCVFRIADGKEILNSFLIVFTISNRLLVRLNWYKF